MIQPNELRIGNALEYFVEDSLAESEWILNIVDADDIVLACKDEYFNKYYRPIPLTPEILEKCGFEKGTTEWYSKKYFTDLNEVAEVMELQINLKSFRCSVFDTDLEGCAMTAKRIKYLHQLQNLHFALTGEELTFKP